MWDVLLSSKKEEDIQLIQLYSYRLRWDRDMDLFFKSVSEVVSVWLLAE